MYIRCSSSFLSLLRSLIARYVSPFIHLSSHFLSLSLSFSLPFPSFFLSFVLSLFLPLARSFLPIADPKAGRYAHFYALIYAHAFTKNNLVSTGHNERLPPVAGRILPGLIPFHASAQSTELSFLLRRASSKAFYSHILRRQRARTCTLPTLYEVRK